MSPPAVSVVIATYNRWPLLERLLGQLSRQTVPPSSFEIVVVDDGSADEMAPRILGLRLPCTIHVHRQANGGAAAARHRGALTAEGDVLLFLDDDMQIPDVLIAEHVRAHEARPHAVVLGRVRPDPSIEMPLFERFHARVLQRFADDVRDGRVVPHGGNVWTGNVSVRRRDYLRSGGFDSELGHSEDAELGIRLEKGGAEIAISEEGYSLHASDHASLEQWMRRAFKYGVFDLRISRKHPEVIASNPWRYFQSLSPASRPFLVASIVAPTLAGVASRAAMRVAMALDAAGLERPALAGATLAYGMEYARGLREESGTVGASVQGYVAYASRSPRGSPRVVDRLAAAATMVDDVRADHAVLGHYGRKYGGREPGALPTDLVERVGFQIMAAYRVMRFFHSARIPLAPKIASRLIRHLYGSDIHWEAEIEPGVMIVHGMGLAISRAARVAKGAILFQNVTLGEGTHPETRAVGAPVVEEDVVVGAGAVLIGPIRIGRSTKIMPNCVLTESIPEGSIVKSPSPSLAARASRGPGAEAVMRSRNGREP